MLKVAFHNLGCKVNSYEMEYMQQSFAENGYEIVPFVEKADIYVVNTCTVTNIADRKSRQMLHRAKAMNPDGIVVAVGCYVQTDLEGARADQAIDVLVGNNEKKNIVAIVENYMASRMGGEQVPDLKSEQPYEEFLLKTTREHTRVSIKIQDGCDQYCSYCIIPYSRGHIRSRALEDIVEEVRTIADTGYSEVVLTGIHLSSYGLDFEENKTNYNSVAAGGEYTNTALLQVIEAVAAIPSVKRIRLGSLEPRVITDSFMSALRKVDQFCPHFHLSLQSGSDSVLKRMNRHYSAAEFAEKADLIRAYFPMGAMTTDVIVGFPQESEEEFDETVAFLEKVNFYETHIFKYSRRKGTVADRMDGQLTEKVKSERSAVLIAAGEKRAQAFRRNFVGRPVEVLIEEEEKLGDTVYLVGHTREYVKVALPLGKYGSGDIVSVVPTGLRTDGILEFLPEK